MKSSTGSRSFLLVFLFVVVVNATKNDNNDVILSSSSLLLLRKEQEQNTSLKQINNNRRRSMLRRQLNNNEQIVSNNFQPLTYLEEEVTALVQEWEDETHSSFHNKSSPNEKEHEQKDDVKDDDDDEEEAENDEITVVIEETASVVAPSPTGTEEKEEEEESNLSDVVIVEEEEEEEEDENDKEKDVTETENEKTTTTTTTQDEYTTDNDNEDEIEVQDKEQEVNTTNTTTTSVVNTTTATTKTKDDDDNEQSTASITSPVTTIITTKDDIEIIEINNSTNNNDTTEKERMETDEEESDEKEKDNKEVTVQQQQQEEPMEIDRYKYYCPIGRESRTLHKIKPSGNKLSEVSYIAYSQQTYKGSSVIWMGSDGAQNTIHAIAMNNGKLIQTYKLHIKRRGDWESISLGPCDDSKTSMDEDDNGYRKKECLYLHNGGNNSGARCHSRDCRSGREYHYIHKLEEPNVNEKYNGNSIKVVTLRYNYEHDSWPSNHNDCESMFVDFTGDNSSSDGNPGDIYILTKQPYDRSYQRIGKLSVKDHQDLIPLNNKKDYYDVIMKAVGKASIEIPWNGSDMTRSGTLIASRRDDLIYFYPRLPNESVVDALEQQPCSYTSETFRDGKHMNRFEAVTFISHYTDDNDESFDDKENKEEEEEEEEEEEDFSTYNNSTYYNTTTDTIQHSMTNMTMNDDGTITNTTTIVTKSRTSQLLSRPPKPAAISLLEVSECGQKKSCKLPVVEYKLLF